MKFLLIFFLFRNNLIHPQVLYFEKLSEAGTYSQIEVSPDSSIFVLNYNQLLISTDGGNNWISSLFEEEIGGIAHDKSGNIYLTTNDDFGGRILKSGNQGDTWETIFGTTEKLGVIKFSEDGRLISGAIDSTRIFISFDYGINWNTKLIPAGGINSVAFIPDSMIFLSTDFNGVYRSTDNGESWTKILDDGYKIISDGSKELFLISYTEVINSTDGGFTWQRKQYPFRKNITNISLNDANDLLLTSDNGLFKISRDTDSLRYLGIGSQVSAAECLGRIIFAAGSYIYKHDPNVQPYMGKNYFPLGIGNEWQYYTIENSGLPLSLTKYGIKNIIIIKDTIIENNSYFNFDNDYYRYDTLLNKLYLYNVSLNNEKLFMDFNLIEGDSLDDERVIMGFAQLFNNAMHYKGIKYEWDAIFAWSSSQTLFTENIGKSSHLSGSHAHGGFNSYYNHQLIQCKIILRDSTVIYSHDYSPEIFLTPIDSFFNFFFNLDFSVDHHYSHLSPPEEYFNYVDTVLLKSYYSKGDSIITRPDEIILNEFQTINYNIETVLDSVLLKQGYSFFYKVSAKDKGILPHYSFSPNSGYYKADYYKITNVRDVKPVTYFSLFQNYPNPFNPSTKIHFQLPERAFVTLKVYDLLGKEIALLINEEKKAGEYSIEFDASGFSSGVYFYSIAAGEFRQVRKMILMK